MSRTKRLIGWLGIAFAVAVVVLIFVWGQPPQPFDDPNPAVFGSVVGVVTTRSTTCDGSVTQLKFTPSGWVTDAVVAVPGPAGPNSLEGTTCILLEPGARLESSSKRGAAHIAMPGVLLLVDVPYGADLGETRFERGAMVVVGSISARLVYRRARPGDEVVLSRPTSLLGVALPAGRIKVPPSGNLFDIHQ